MDERFSKRLAELRTNRGYSQEELGKMLFVSRQAVSKWERGDAAPDIDNLTALAKIFGVSLDELLVGAETVERKESEDGRKKEALERERSRVRIYAAVSAVLALLPFVVLCFWLPFLPKTIPAHYDAAGSIDRWGSKYELLTLAAVDPIIAAIVAAVGAAMRKGVSESDRGKVAKVLFWTLARCMSGLSR